MQIWLTKNDGGFMAKLRKATIRVNIQTKPNTRYDLYIDGVLSEKYEFDKINSDYGMKDINIVVHEGAIMISEEAAEAEYPTINENPVWVYQKRYCDWLYSDFGDVEYDTWYKGTVSYKHLWPQGPSYYKEKDGKVGRPVWEYQKIFNPMAANKKETSALLRRLLGLY